MANSFRESCILFQDDFNSINRRTRVRTHLQSLRLDDMVMEKNMTLSEALVDLRETTTKLSPHGLRTLQSEQ